MGINQTSETNRVSITSDELRRTAVKCDTMYQVLLMEQVYLKAGFKKHNNINDAERFEKGNKLFVFDGDLSYCLDKNTTTGETLYGFNEFMRKYLSQGFILSGGYLYE